MRVENNIPTSQLCESANGPLCRHNPLAALKALRKVAFSFFSPTKSFCAACKSDLRVTTTLFLPINSMKIRRRRRIKINEKMRVELGTGAHYFSALVLLSFSWPRPKLHQTMLLRRVCSGLSRTAEKIIQLHVHGLVKSLALHETLYSCSRVHKSLPGLCTLNENLHKFKKKSKN